MRIVPLSDFDSALRETEAAVKNGLVVIYPTDTLYGLGCDATNKGAVRKVYGIKSRGQKNPLSIIVPDLGMLEKYCEVTDGQRKILATLLPGPYTFLLKLKIPLPVTDSGIIGVRVPEHMFMRTVSRRLGIPVVSTSANLSGGGDAADASEIDAGILNSKKVSLIVDGGRCKYAKASTVIDLVDMKVVRKGAIREGDRVEFPKN